MSAARSLGCDPAGAVAVANSRVLASVLDTSVSSETAVSDAYQLDIGASLGSFNAVDSATEACGGSGACVSFPAPPFPMVDLSINASRVFGSVTLGQPVVNANERSGAAGRYASANAAAYRSQSPSPVGSPAAATSLMTILATARSGSEASMQPDASGAGTNADASASGAAGASGSNGGSSRQPSGSWIDADDNCNGASRSTDDSSGGGGARPSARPSSSSWREVDEALSCTICCNMFVDPVMLETGNTFCRRSVGHWCSACLLPLTTVPRSVQSGYCGHACRNGDSPRILSKSAVSPRQGQALH